MKKKLKHRIFAFYAVTALLLAVGRPVFAQAPRFAMDADETRPNLFSTPDAEICRQALATLSPSESPKYQPGIAAGGAPVPEADLPGSARSRGGIPGSFLPSTRLYVDPKITEERLPSSLQGETRVGTFTIAPNGASRLNGYPLSGEDQALIDACRAAGYR